MSKSTILISLLSMFVATTILANANENPVVPDESTENDKEIQAIKTEEENKLVLTDEERRLLSKQADATRGSALGY